MREETHGDKEYSGLLGIIRKFVFPKLDGFVFQSHGAQNYFKQKIRDKSVIIYNPVLTNKENCILHNIKDKRIVTVGRLHNQKNQKLLINSFKKISNLFPEYILEIYGEGEEKENLLKLINFLGLENKVFLRGTSKNICQEICNASVFILSSDYEGLPNALIEAMSLGLPCISTDCKPGGAREIIEDGVDGIIVPINDQKSLEEAMIKIITDKNLSIRFSKNAEKNIKRFSKEKIYEEWENFFEFINTQNR